MTRRVARKTFQSSFPGVKDVKQIAVRRLTSLLYYSAESRQLTIATTEEESLNKDTSATSGAGYHSEITMTFLHPGVSVKSICLNALAKKINDLVPCRAQRR